MRFHLRGRLGSRNESQMKEVAMINLTERTFLRKRTRK